MLIFSVFFSPHPDETRCRLEGSRSHSVSFPLTEDLTGELAVCGARVPTCACHGAWGDGAMRSSKSHLERSRGNKLTINITYRVFVFLDVMELPR